MTGSVIWLSVALCGQPPAAQPAWLNAYDVKVRAAGQKEFTGAGRLAVEFFRDPPAGAVLAVSEKGQIAVVPDGQAGAEKSVGWLYAHDLKARTPDEEQFSPKTKAYGVEVLKDQLTGKLLFLSQTGGLALADYPPTVLTDKDVKFHHALKLAVRSPAEEQFTDKTKQVGVEVYLDGNSGRLVYVSDAGFLATAPAPADLKAGDASRKTAPLYGRAMRVRKADDSAYTDATPRVGVEVYKDAASGHLLYVTETGSLAVVPTPVDLKKGLGFREERGLRLSARPAGEVKYEKAARVGVEVITDNNSGHTLYLADTGSIAVLPKK